MTDETPRLKQIHDEFCRITNATLQLTVERCYWWSMFLARGWTADDLRLVVRHIDRGIETGRRFPGAKKFSNLIQQPDHFEEELSEALAEQRNRKAPPTPKEIVRQQFSPVVGEEAKPNTRTIKDVLEAMREAAK